MADYATLLRDHVTLRATNPVALAWRHLDRTLDEYMESQLVAA